MVVIYHRNTPLPNVRKGLDGYMMSLHKLHVALQILQNVNLEQPLKVITYATTMCSLSICIYIARECSTRNMSFQKHTLHLKANL
jgi:hypothetical protein